MGRFSGKFIIHDQDAEVRFIINKDPAHAKKLGTKVNDFPFRKVVLCPECKRPLHGSASRGKLGKYYPAYHCRRDGHSVRLPLAEFEETIERFIKSLRPNKAHMDAFEEKVLKEWEKRNAVHIDEVGALEERITALSLEARQSMDKIKFLNNETAIKFIEDEVTRIEKDIENLQYEKSQIRVDQPLEMRDIMRYARYFFEHLDVLILQQSNPVEKANFFSIIFT